MVKSLFKTGLILSLTFLLFSSVSKSQVDYNFITGSSKYAIDTLAFNNAQKMVEKTQGILEKEIDPETYIMGPNDEFRILITSADPVDFNAIVSPEGKLMLKGSGVVNLKNKTLAESYEIIKTQLNKYYKNNDINVLLKDIRRFKVTVSGSVAKPITVIATAVDRLSEIIDRAGGLKYGASLRKITILRDDKKINIDLLKYYILGDKAANPTVTGGDIVIIPPSAESETIEIFGEIPHPGVFEFIAGDSLSTLIRFGLGFLESSFLDSIELSRVPTNGQKELSRLYINLNSWRELLSTGGPLPGDLPLKVGDRIYVRKLPDWQKLEYVVVKGEVRFPGKYAINENTDVVSDLIKRSGGFTENAAIEAIEFVRQSELEKSDPEMQRLSKTPSSEMSRAESRYFQSRINEKKGVMSVDFQKILNDPNVGDNIILRNRDSIIVPMKKDYITVQGRVNNPGSVRFKPGAEFEEYIANAGGYGFRPDIKETFIAKSKGQIYIAKDKNYKLEPGDVILVPPEKEVDSMEVFTTSLTIATQLITIGGVILTIVRLK